MNRMFWQSCCAGRRLSKSQVARSQAGWQGLEPLEARVLLSAITPPTDPGDSVATAFDLGSLSTTGKGSRLAVRSDAPPGDADWYRLEITGGLAQVKFQLGGMRADLDLRIRNADGDVISRSTNSGNRAERLIDLLEPGVYFIEVEHFSGNASNYRLKVAVKRGILPPDAAGASADEAHDFGVIGGRVKAKARDHVNLFDEEDFYRFELTAPSRVKIVLNGLKADADISLLDGDENVLQTSREAGNRSEKIDRDPDDPDRPLVLLPGVYFVRVFRFAGATRYNLRIAAKPVPLTAAAAPAALSAPQQQSLAQLLQGPVRLGAPMDLEV